MNIISIYRIRKIIPVFPPLYISVCAVLLLNIETNLKLDYASILFYISMIFFFTACFMSNKLYNVCNISESIYMIELNEYVKGNQTDAKPNKKQIYDKIENKSEIKMLHSYGFFIFGILGLFCIIFSNISQKYQYQKSETPNTMLQKQVDTLEQEDDDNEIINIEQADESINE